MRKKLFVFGVFLCYLAFVYCCTIVYAALDGGSSSNDAPWITSTSTTINMYGSGDPKRVFKFIPTDDNMYTIQTDSDSDPYAALYDDPSLLESVASDDDNGIDYNPLISLNLTKNTMYYLVIFDFDVYDGVPNSCTLSITGGGLRTNNSPTISIANPSLDRLYKDSETISISGSVSDSDGDGITVSATINGQTATSASITGSGTWTVTWNTGTISDGTYTGIVFTANDGLGGTNTASYTGNIIIDKTGPLVSSVSVPGSGIYKVGQSLDFTVTFDENVTVTGTNSTLGLDVGGVTRYAVFQSKTATSITYRYTIAAGDQDTDGIGVTGITLNTSTIKDAVGNNANLTLNGVGSTAGVLVDGIASVISSVSVPGDRSYGIGQHLNFTVNFNEDITVTGTDSTLGLNIGGVVKNATYQSKTANSITYRYTVAVGDRDTNGIGINGITLNTSTIKDTAGNDANLTLSGVGSTTGVLVDGIAPKVSSVSVPGNGVYGIGQFLNFTVNFDEDITITGSNSSLGLDIGGVTKNAIFQSNTATNITYRYTVVAGDQDTNGITVTGITLNGTTITDTAGNNANLTLNGVGNTAGVLADGIAPEVTSVTVPANRTYVTGENLSFTVNFNQAVTVTGGTPYIPVTLDTGGTVHASYRGGSGTTALIFRYTVKVGDGDSNGIVIGGSINANGASLRDGASNDAVLTLNGVGATTGINVSGVATTINFINPQNGSVANISTGSTVIVDLISGTGINTGSVQIQIDGGAWVQPTALVATAQGYRLFYVIKNINLAVASHMIAVKFNDLGGVPISSSITFMLNVQRNGFGFGKLRF